MNYTFKLPIGDWSGDGHEKCDWFTVVSNKPVEEVREAHFKGCEILDVHKLLGRYEESSIDAKTFAELPDWAKKFFIPSGVNYYLVNDTEGMAELWVAMLTQADPELVLTLDEEPPMLPFFGHDEKKRHINFVGYGLFY